MNIRDKTLHRKDNSEEYRRIEQVLVILNNLSFEENNAEFMANQCRTLLEFLILCVFCDKSECYVELKKHALDILSNISRRIKLTKLAEADKYLILISIDYLINGNKGNYISMTEPFREVQSQEKFDIIRGLEILTKLCSQKVDANESEDYINELIITTSILKNNPKNQHLTSQKKYYDSKSLQSELFLKNILKRFECLISVQDIFILLHSLECLYSMTQFSENACDMIVGYDSSPRIVNILIQLLTIDMTHFGISTLSDPKIKYVTQNNATSLKVYKVIPTNSIMAQTVQPVLGNNPSTLTSTKNATNVSLLHQTLNNQHVSSNVGVTKLNTNLQQTNNLNISNGNKTLPSNQDQIAKNVLCNW